MTGNDGIRSAFDDDDDTNELLASFAPKPATETLPAQPEKVEQAVEQVAKKRGFQVRAKPKKKAMRRSQFYQTGRSVQIAMKGRGEDKQRLDDTCNKQDWVKGQLLEYALDALAEKIADPDNPFWDDRNFEGVD